jgi:hypothetical protein
VVAMLRSSEEMIQLQAAVAIRNLSFSPENEVRLRRRTECRMLTYADVCFPMLTYAAEC